LAGSSFGNAEDRGQLPALEKWMTGDEAKRLLGLVARSAVLFPPSTTPGGQAIT